MRVGLSVYQQLDFCSIKKSVYCKSIHFMYEEFNLIHVSLIVLYMVYFNFDCVKQSVDYVNIHCMCD